MICSFGVFVLNGCGLSTSKILDLRLLLCVGRLAHEQQVCSMMMWYRARVPIVVWGQCRVY